MKSFFKLPIRRFVTNPYWFWHVTSHFISLFLKHFTYRISCHVGYFFKFRKNSFYIKFRRGKHGSLSTSTGLKCTILQTDKTV